MSESRLVEALRRAVAAVDKADVPDDLRSDAFRVAWQQLGGQTPAPLAGTPAQQPVPKQESDAEGAWTELAGRLPGVTVEQLQDVYELQEDGTFEVRVPTPKLPKAKTEATKALGLLVCAGRQKIIEDSTIANAVISAAKDYGKFDSPNFAATMADGDEYWQIEGKGRNKKYRLRRTGWEAAANLIKAMFEE